MVTIRNVTFSAKTQLWCGVLVVILAMVMEVATLNGPNVCMVKQKYNITKRVKYRAPLSVRTYEWCMSIPPRCSKWSTEMRDLTKLETEERTAEVAVCCPGYKMKDVSCVPICPEGRTGHGCSQECPPNKWGPNCVNECRSCSNQGSCSPFTGECSCQDGWQGESCDSRMSPITSTTTTTARVEELLTKKPPTKPTQPSSAFPPTTTTASVETTSTSTPSKTINTSTTRPITTEIASIRTNFQGTGTTHEIISEESISSTKEIAKIDNTQGTRKTTLLESTTVKTNPLTTSATSILTTIEATTTKARGTTPVILKTKLPDTISLKPSTNEDYVKSILNNNGSTATDTHKIKTIDIMTIIPSASTESYNPTTLYNNLTLTTHRVEMFRPITPTTQKLNVNTISNRTEPTEETKNYPKEVHVEIKTTPVRILKASDVSHTAATQKTTAITVYAKTPMVTTHATTITEGTTKIETTRRPDATIRYFPTTVKFKPKEIWIRPAQKGESFESKKMNELQSRHRVATNKEPPNTTPKTIIVSIIPTSVSYAMFKKISLTTASDLPQMTNITLKTNSTGQGFTKPMSVLTTLSPLSSNISTLPTSAVAHATNSSIIKSVNASKSNEYFHHVAKTFSTLSNAGTAWRNKTVSSNGTNSMATVTQNLNSSNFITPTVPSTNFITSTHKASFASDKLKDATRSLQRVTKPIIKAVTAKPFLYEHATTNDKEKTNATKIKDISKDNTNKITTESPDDEETFHILTEPEHITAVMEGKEKQRTSVDLISVISIAGGIMMAVITVAVIIVMVERCRRLRYEDVRKMNDIHMQVIIDNNDVPPPYVRSIFHTPLPDPPSSDKCHYQPISTLDRNLKQFMRPVVVQSISPIMLENFRGILECHYDHLPRRSHDFEARRKNCSITPSGDDVDELTRLRPCSSIAESTIDALKCEAKLDVLDSTTSEPLYAEIPCWRPPSEHAIEIMNYNGEAVTEL